MSELSVIYPSTINRAYYIASFLMRDENLTMDVLKESYAQVGQYSEMLEEGTQVQALVDRIVSAQALEDLRLKDNVSYQSFYQAEDEDHSFYIDRDKLEPFVPKPESVPLDRRGVSSYDKAAGRFVTTLRLQPQPQSDAAFLYYYVEMSVKEIAAAMDVSEDVVQGHLHASNVKLMADAENWMKQGRIPAGIDTIPFLIWALKRDAQRNPYRGVNLLKVLNQTGDGASQDNSSSSSRRETDAQRRAEQELAGDARTVSREPAENAEPVVTLPNDADLEENLRPEESRPPRRFRRSERNDADSDEAYHDQTGSKHSFPIIPVGIIILAVLVVIVIAAGLHHRSTVAEQSTSSSSTSTVVSPSEKKEKTSDSSSSSSESASSSSSEDKKTYDDPMDDPNGYIFPNSNKEYLKDSDLEGMDKEHLRIARNELYARYGVIFGMDDLNNYFKSKSWYEPKVTIKDFDSSVFNQYENANLKLILKYEQQAQ